MCPLLSLSHLVNFIFISFSVAFCVANVASIFEFSLLFIADLTGLAAKKKSKMTGQFKCYKNKGEFNPAYSMRSNCCDDHIWLQRRSSAELHVGRDTISKALNTFQLYQMW